MDRNLLNRKLHAMLNELGIAHSKEALLEGYGVESSKYLTEADFIHLINRLDEMKKAKKEVPQDVKKLRSEILSILQKMNIYTTNNDWAAVNKFLLDQRIAGKLMYEMSAEELRVLKTKLHAIYDKWKQQQFREVRLANVN